MKKMLKYFAAALFACSLTGCHSINEYKEAVVELREVLTKDNFEQSKELCSALNLNNFSLVKQAVEDGADVNVLDGTFRTSSVLLMAYYCECSDEIIDFLKEQGSNSALGTSESDWWDLIVNGGCEQIRLLIQDGFDYKQYELGMTSFSAAIATGSNSDEEEYQILTALFEAGYKITKSDFKIACRDEDGIRSFARDPKTARLIAEQLEKQGDLDFATEQFIAECNGSSIKRYREFSFSDLVLIAVYGSVDDLDFALARSSSISKAARCELTANAVEYGNGETFDYLVDRGYSPYWTGDSRTIEPDIQTCIDNGSTELLARATTMASDYFFSQIIDAAEALSNASIFQDFFYRTGCKISDLTSFCKSNSQVGKELFEFAVKNSVTLTASKVSSGVAERFLQLGGDSESVLQGIVTDREAYANVDFLRSLVNNYNVDFGEYGHLLILQAIRIGCCEVVEYLSSLGFILDYDSMYSDSNIKKYDELLYMTKEMRQTLKACGIPIYGTRKEWESK